MSDMAPEEFFRREDEETLTEGTPGLPTGSQCTNGHGAPWPVMEASAYHGLAGDIVRAISPHSEADPAALLIQLLASAGNAVGRGPYYQVEGDRHGPNIYAVLVGETAKGRKGTSGGRIRQIMEVAAPQTFLCGLWRFPRPARHKCSDRADRP